MMTHNFRIPLAPPDYVFTGPSPYSIQFAFFFRERQHAEAIRDGLQRTLDHFYPVKGQLILDHEHFYIQPGLSIDLEVIEHGAQESLPIQFSPSLLADFYLEVKAEEHSPLAQFCLHQYQDGAILVANIAHCIVDGYSFFYFMNSWACECRGESYHLPCHERDRLIPNAMAQDIATEPRLFETQLSHKTGFTVDQERQFRPLSEIHWETQRISTQQIETLKNTCLPVQVSNNAVLCAQLWKNTAQRWHDPNNPEIVLALNCALDFRRIYRKIIPPHYFGNAIKGARCQLSLKDVMHLPLGEIARQIESCVLGHRADDIDQHLWALERFRERYGVKRMPCLHVSDPNTGLLVTNLSRVCLSDLDFGLGPPLFLVPLVSASRVGVILPNQQGLMAMIAHPPSLRPMSYTHRIFFKISQLAR